MEFGPVLVKFSIIKDNTVIHSGEIYSQFLNTLADAFLDFEETSECAAEIRYLDQIIKFESPAGHIYKDKF